MPIPFHVIPEHLQQSVIQKVDISDFASFYQTSRIAFDAAKQVKTRFVMPRRNVLLKYATNIFGPNPQYNPQDTSRSSSPLFQLPGLYVKLFKENEILRDYRIITPLSKFTDLPIRFENVHVQACEGLSTEFCTALVKFLTTTNSSIDHLLCDTIVSCSPEALGEVAATGRVRSMSFFGLLPPKYLKIKEISNISTFSVLELEDNETLPLELMSVTVLISNITSAAINTILKELFDGKRKIGCYILNTYQEIQKEVVFNGIPNCVDTAAKKKQRFLIGKEKAYVVSIADDHIRINHVHK